jgi:uncharacterized oxidoreductase
MNLSGNTILITGGSVGIGFKLAEALLARGNRVLTCGRRAERLREAQRKLPKLEVLACDVGSAQGRRDLAQWAIKVAPELNVLVNNAGVQHKISFLDGEDPEGRDFEELAINLLAPMHLSQLLIPHLRKQSAPVIVNITSGLAFTPFAIIPVYCATKAAMHSFSMSLRYQLRSTPVRVLETIPPLVESELHDHQKGPAPTLSAMPTGDFVAACLEGWSKDIETHAIGFASGLYEKRDGLFGMLNPS